MPPAKPLGLVLIALTSILSMPALAAGTPDAIAADAGRLAEVRKILREVPLIDGHNDVPWQYRKRKGGFEEVDLASDTSKLKSPMVTDIARLRAGGVGGQFWSVYIPTSLTNGAGVQAVLEQIDVVHRMVAHYPDTFELALTAGDVERIHSGFRAGSD